MKNTLYTKGKKYNQLLIIPISILSLALSLNASTIEPITNWNTYPIPQEVVSKSRGGLLVDKLAMKDGVGSILIKSVNGNSITLNNEQYNQLLLLNKDKLTDTVGLKELIANGDIVVDASTLNSINGNGLSNPTGLPVDGTSCNDNNPLTNNDIYTNKVCLGTSIVGTSCDDGLETTINDIYNASGTCIGTIRTGTCDDNNASTSNDVYDSNGICIGVVADGTVCDDGNAATIGDTYTNGVCSGFLSDSYSSLISYINNASGTTINVPKKIYTITSTPISNGYNGIFAELTTSINGKTINFNGSKIIGNITLSNSWYSSVIQFDAHLNNVRFQNLNVEVSYPSGIWSYFANVKNFSGSTSYNVYFENCIFDAKNISYNYFGYLNGFTWRFTNSQFLNFPNKTSYYTNMGFINFYY